jgi:hypothetical protein
VAQPRGIATADEVIDILVSRSNKCERLNLGEARARQRALRANGPLVTKLRRVGYNCLIQLKITLGRVALVSA